MGALQPIMGWGGSGKGGWGMDPMTMMMMSMMGKGGGKGKGKKRNDRKLAKFDADKKVWVGNLPESTTWKELEAHFESLVKPKYCEVFKGKGKGTGGIAFAEASEAAQAIKKFNKSSLGGQKIEVDV